MLGVLRILAVVRFFHSYCPNVIGSVKMRSFRTASDPSCLLLEHVFLIVQGFNGIYICFGKEEPLLSNVILKRTMQHYMYFFKRRETYFYCYNSFV